MNPLMQTPRTAEFILSCGNGAISTEVITLAPGIGLLAGQVLAYHATTQHHDVYDPTSTELNQAAAVLYATQAARIESSAVVAVVRLAEVDTSQLIGFDNAARADLATRHIIAR